MIEYRLIYDLLIAVLAISCLFPGYRLMVGPSLADRAIAFDNIAINTCGLLALVCIRLHTVDYIEAILIVALLGFLGTLSIARFIERGQLIVTDFDEAQRRAGLTEGSPSAGTARVAGVPSVEQGKES